MQPYIPQAMVAARIADMHQEAESDRLAHEVRRARRRARRSLAQVLPFRTTAHPVRGDLPVAVRTERAERPAA